MDIATDLMINEEIRDREVRLIDENGEQLGVMMTRKALELERLAATLLPQKSMNGWGKHLGYSYGTRPFGL